VHNPLKERRAGVLLHPTSLPGRSGQGVLGPAARQFINFLAEAGFSVWQMLPLGPPHADRSPYQCLSVHAGNVGLVSLEDLVSDGWLDAALPERRSHRECLNRSRKVFEQSATATEKEVYSEFREAHAYWLEDYVVYQAIRQVQGDTPWYQWPDDLRKRDNDALDKFRLENRELVEQSRFEQFLFFKQWNALRSYAHRRGLYLFGDMPIYVAHDSADVWLNRRLFSTDASGALEVVGGVPPDYFSATGQRWGNPLYRWDRIRAEDYAWWLDRFRTQLAMFDIIRLDHFRGFEKYWEIPSACETAVDGRWVDGPGADLFARLEKEFGELPLVAEDLGVITPEVDALRRRFGFPGMKILQFAFDSGPDNPYLPANHEPLSVVYTGTHDNDTTLGWYESLDNEQRQAVSDALKRPLDDMPWSMNRAALASVANLAILPMQDLLGLGSSSRMNTPGTGDGNWCWRFDWARLPAGFAGQLRALLERYNRTGSVQSQAWRREPGRRTSGP
jgi:4-alpha-glucanotransferase